MTDHDGTLLASAYLDGEATAAERARVDDDPLLRAEVDRLRAVRAIVGDVPGPRVSAREAHLAAALEAWDRIPSERDATPAGSPSAARRRRSQATTNRWLLAAAAATVVVLVGGLTLRTLTDRDDGDDGGSIAADQPATVDESGDAGTGAEEDSLALSEAVEEAEAAVAPAATPDPDTADPDTDPTADAVAAAPPPDDDLAVLTSPSELALFAADALAADGDVAAANADVIQSDDDAGSQLPSGSRTIPPADEESLGVADLPLCGDADLNVGPAIYDDTTVLVSIDLDRQRALAYVVPECRLLAQARLESAD